MQTIRHNGHELKIYDSIDEMPIKRFHQFNRMMLIESGVGSDLAAFDRNLGSLIRYLEKGDQEKAVRVVENMRQNVNFIYTGVSPEFSSFVCLIHSMDGRALTDEDMSNEGAQAILDQLSQSNTPVGLIRKLVSEVKKNWRLNLRSFSRRSPILSR